MTAPIPSPSEQATIDRLGLWDEEKFAEITEGTFTCDLCENTAGWLFTMKCCEASGMYCDTHWQRKLRAIDVVLQTARVPGCCFCPRVFRRGVTVVDIAEVVIL